ncbi:hypothetical protein EYZ11_007703 [Aspergillus tanneri]|uniref:Phosphatidylglycerol/phosphatidylinositol transfer protein n=1 Tax=Aspergillus tanneri TaxID=1220188 RepID=A0A4S3JI02_9EURO|nr:uncharacterized protein ATNIH1004_004354 [Aspergillus tanneri]KAA8648469.1 hypothetical protein ATNIH1004_004354 [Aspergillus tanneri]THC92831.1 hypothetical protein EYZ11_007703 [Aspergillus tanneri]
MNTLFLLASLTAGALAQNAAIGLPKAQESIQAGANNLVVQVQRPNTLTGSEEVAVVIGIQSCADSPCRDPKDVMGHILYNGPFKPVYHEASLPPYQNFTVTVPKSVGAGKAVIGVAHVALVGAGPFPMLQTLEQSVQIA